MCIKINAGSSPAYAQDVNKVNPDGNGGKLAQSFSKLIQSMWDGTYLTKDLVVFKVI